MRDMQSNEINDDVILMLIHSKSHIYFRFHFDCKFLQPFLTDDVIILDCFHRHKMLLFWKSTDEIAFLDGGIELRKAILGYGTESKQIEFQLKRLILN